MFTEALNEGLNREESIEGPILFLLPPLVLPILSCFSFKEVPPPFDRSPPPPLEFAVFKRHFLKRKARKQKYIVLCAFELCGIVYFFW